MLTYFLPCISLFETLFLVPCKGEDKEKYAEKIPLMLLFKQIAVICQFG